MKNVPNIITCLNLFAGCLSCIMTLEYGNYIGAFFFIALAALFDFLDGFAARLLKAFSPIGADLDSLADVISFGLAPGLMVFSFLGGITPGLAFAAAGIPYLALLIPIFAALRLAKFNVDTRQTSSFIGLPVPANALFWASLIPVISLIESNAVFLTALVCVLIIAFSLLMVSELPMFSLKFNYAEGKENRMPYILISSTIALIILFRLWGISLSILLYIVLSVFSNRNHEKK
jgi:CDP-diacylglycerol--serine O-phosphatidyltransferase